MLAHQESLLALTSSQPVHVQHDPAGESRRQHFDGAFSELTDRSRFQRR
jgi:hypothetical protein